MKRMYIKPEISIEEFVTVTETMLATSNGTDSGGTIDPSTPAVPAANSHRGGWGNLWGGDE